jgi:hypothetical protein
MAAGQISGEERRSCVRAAMATCLYVYKHDPSRTRFNPREGGWEESDRPGRSGTCWRSAEPECSFAPAVLLCMVGF